MPENEVKRAFSEDGTLKTHVGGQALLEGIMMRGKYNWAVAVREPSGDIYTEEHDLASGRADRAWLRWPIIRGCTAFVESLALSYKALDIAAQHAFTNEELTEDDAEAFTHRDTVISMTIGLVLGVLIFIVAPAFLTNLLVGEYDERTLTWNLVDGILRVLILVGYIWLIGRMKDIRRMFGYHGAEHKTIHCYEHQQELTAENACSYPRFHVRCGTAFLIMVMFIAILVYTITPLNALISAWGVPDGALKLALVIVVRIVLLPLIAGLAYEINVKWAGAHPDNPLVKVILWPGMQMQRLTTYEPDEGQIECAIAAMKMVLEREQREEAAGNTVRAN